MLAATEASGLMFNPDTGHIIRGGQDLLDCFRRHRSRLVHVHCKERRRSRPLAADGQRHLRFPRLFHWLREIGYRGWLISEEESDLVLAGTARGHDQNRAYFQSLGY